jgi:LEA14-like dessication related protein
MDVVRPVALAAALAIVVHAAPARAEVAPVAPVAPVAAVAEGALAQPTLALRGCSVAQVEASGTTLAFDAQLANPTGAIVLLGGVSYALEVEGKRIFEGTVPGGVEVPAGGSQAVPLPGRVRYADLPGALAKMATKKPVPYRLVAAKYPVV